MLWYEVYLCAVVSVWVCEPMQQYIGIRQYIMIWDDTMIIYLKLSLENKKQNSYNLVIIKKLINQLFNSSYYFTKKINDDLPDDLGILKFHDLNLIQV